MGKLRTPSRHMGQQRHQVATERNQQRVTDAVPLANPDRSDGDMSVGNMTEMARAEGSDTPARAGQSNEAKSRQFRKV